MLAAKMQPTKPPASAAELMTEVHSKQDRLKAYRKPSSTARNDMAFFRLVANTDDAISFKTHVKRNEKPPA